MTGEAEWTSSFLSRDCKRMNQGGVRQATAFLPQHVEHVLVPQHRKYFWQCCPFISVEIMSFII